MSKTFTRILASTIKVLTNIQRPERAERNRLMVRDLLVTPHIIKEGKDLERVTQHKVGEYHAVNVQEFIDRGFFKKVLKKRATRKNHRPTFSKSEAMTRGDGSPNFGRGDIER